MSRTAAPKAHSPAVRSTEGSPVIRAALLVAAAVSLAACGDQPQSATGIKSDAAAFQGTGKPYVATGWKPGDKNSWEQQLKTRTQNGQNDYVKTP